MIDKLKNRFVTGAWLTDVKHYFSKINEIIDRVNNIETFTYTYKVYTALLTQTFNNPPVATVLENTLGGNIVWTYDQSGVYIGTLTGAFTLDKTAGIISGIPTGTAKVYRKNDNEVYVQTRDFGGVTKDNKLGETTIEIRVYN